MGTFVVNNGNKQGGNVATYFCLPDGSALHAIPGPVNAEVLLREARWVVEIRKMALFEAQGDSQKYREFFRKAHSERLQQHSNQRGHWIHGQRFPMVANPGSNRRPTNLPVHFPDASDSLGMARLHTTLMQQGNFHLLDNQAKVHQLLSYYPLVRVEQIYRFVFERILNERVSTLPVVQN